MATTAAPGAQRERLLRNWKYVLATTNPPRGRMDPVSKWLYLTRAGVLPMTLVSASVAGLLAVYRDADVTWGWFALSALGLVLAHMSNNLMNDLFDLEVGTDREDYPRNLYSPHPVLSGVVTRRQLASYALVVNLICLAIMIVLTVARGWPILAFALGGFLLSAAYTAPPLRLKKHGLGEPTVLVVWGPLMVGGTYYAATGSIPGAVVLASLPYALLCTTVLMGKHIDKIPWDAPGRHAHAAGSARRDARTRRDQGDVRRVLRVDRRARHRAGAAGRVRVRVRVAADHGAHVEGVLGTEARRLAGAEPGVAALVRGGVVPRHAPGGRPVRARLDRGRRPRLVSAGAGTFATKGRLGCRRTG